MNMNYNQCYPYNDVINRTNYICTTNKRTQRYLDNCAPAITGPQNPAYPTNNVYTNCATNKNNKNCCVPGNGIGNYAIRNRNYNTRNNIRNYNNRNNLTGNRYYRPTRLTGCTNNRIQRYNDTNTRNYRMNNYYPQNNNVIINQYDDYYDNQYEIINNGYVNIDDDYYNNCGEQIIATAPGVQVKMIKKKKYKKIKCETSTECSSSSDNCDCTSSEDCDCSSSSDCSSASSDNCNCKITGKCKCKPFCKCNKNKCNMNCKCNFFKNYKIGYETDTCEESTNNVTYLKPEYVCKTKTKCIESDCNVKYITKTQCKKIDADKIYTTSSECNNDTSNNVTFIVKKSNDSSNECVKINKCDSTSDHPNGKCKNKLCKKCYVIEYTNESS